MKSKIFSLPMLAVVILGVLIASCGKEHKLLDAIPSTVEQAGTVKLKSALEQAGCKFENGVGTTPEGMQAPDRLTNIVELVGKLDASGACDVNDVAWAVDATGNFFMTMLVNDRAKFKEASSGQIEWADETGDFTCGKAGAMAVLLDDERVWCTDAAASDAVGKVEALVKEAKESSLSAMTGLEQLLGSDNLLNVVARQDNAKDKKGKKGAKGENPELEAVWATVSCNVKDNKLVANSSLMQADGTQVAFKGLTKVNPAVLAYVPENFNVAFGLGVTPEFDWSILTRFVGAVGGFQSQAMLSAVTPYLQSIDGTIFLAAGPANSEAYTDLEPGNWQFVMMVRLPQQKINDIMGMVRSSLFMAGISPRQEKDGIMIVPQYGMNLYMGNVDGYFAVSNLPFEPTRQNSLAPVFNGKEGALSIDLPTLREFGPRMPEFGIKLQVQLNSDNTTAELSLNGSETPILQAILKALV
ncbi:hypothetical protein [uncultured Duncaniella sp.]|uniref:hypothetical protein n=1 Tax=uncultured Duncaniella sp. TaxID=2768039 RepID=UPI002633D97C|nr:hypothetical protein [uncultured Duncaniella sp.]